jgi:hypothetical protein
VAKASPCIVHALSTLGWKASHHDTSSQASAQVTSAGVNGESTVYALDNSYHELTLSPMGTLQRAS